MVETDQIYWIYRNRMTWLGDFDLTIANDHLEVLMGSLFSRVVFEIYTFVFFQIHSIRYCTPS